MDDGLPTMWLIDDYRRFGNTPLKVDTTNVKVKVSHDRDLPPSSVPRLIANYPPAPPISELGPPWSYNPPKKRKPHVFRPEQPMVTTSRRMDKPCTQCGNMMRDVTAWARLCTDCKDQKKREYHIAYNRRRPARMGDAQGLVRR